MSCTVLLQSSYDISCKQESYSTNLCTSSIIHSARVSVFTTFEPEGRNSSNTVPENVAESL
jgi:hypothetical protein